MKNFENKSVRYVYATLGASNHFAGEREENDYYATSPIAVELLLEKQSFNKNIWECASGGGHMSKVLRKHGYNVRCSDIIDRTGDTEILDFLTYKGTWNGDVVTNPPYKYAQEFVEKALEIVPDGNKVAMYLKLTFLEGKKRQKMFKKYPPKYIYVAVGRIGCAKNGIFTTDKENEYETSAIAYAWFIWEKGYTGEPVIRWFN